MWFNNLHLYRVHGQAQIDSASLEERLAEQAARPVGNQEARRSGWTFPADRNWRGTQLHHELQGQRLLTMLRQERILPSSVVREEVEERAADIEARECRVLRRQEKQELKEQVFEELLPRAFIRSQRIDVWWDTGRQLIGINAASRARAEEALDLLRMSLGSLKVTPLATQTLPMRAMTEWLADVSTRPPMLQLGNRVELKAKGDDGVVRGRHVDLDSDEMQQHLAAGRQASKLELEIEGLASFLLHDDLSIKGLHFADTLLDEASEAENHDDAVLRMETDFIIMAKALGQAIDLLIEWMGGEAQSPAPLLDGATLPDGVPDPIYEQAKAFVIEGRKASISAVQRHLKIGYNRAARILEAMEAEGIISPLDGSGARTVLAA